MEQRDEIARLSHQINVAEVQDSQAVEEKVMVELNYERISGLQIRQFNELLITGHSNHVLVLLDLQQDDLPLG